MLSPTRAEVGWMARWLAAIRFKGAALAESCMHQGETQRVRAAWKA